jgi:hypothetical protein
MGKKEIVSACARLTTLHQQFSRLVESCSTLQLNQTQATDYQYSLCVSSRQFPNIIWQSISSPEFM